MNGYSRDLRERVVALRETGETQGRIVEVLGLSISTVKRYLVQYEQTGTVAATVQGWMQPRWDEAEWGFRKGTACAAGCDATDDCRG